MSSREGGSAQNRRLSKPTGLWTCTVAWDEERREWLVTRERNDRKREIARARAERKLAEEAHESVQALLARWDERPKPKPRPFLSEKERILVNEITKLQSIVDEQRVQLAALRERAATQAAQVSALRSELDKGWGHGAFPD